MMIAGQNLRIRERFLFSPVFIVPAYAAFLGSVEVCTIALSLCHVRIDAFTAWAILLVSLCLAWQYGRRLSRGVYEPVAACMAQAPLSRAAKSFVLAGALLYGYLWLMAWARPDISFDGNWYHTPNIHFWARQGYVHWVCPESGGAWSRRPSRRHVVRR